MRRRKWSSTDILKYLAFLLPRGDNENAPLVYCKRLQPKSQKLQSRYIGSFRVIKLLPDAVEVKSLYNNKIYVVHLSHVVPLFQIEDDVSVFPTPLQKGDIPQIT